MSSFSEEEGFSDEEGAVSEDDVSEGEVPEGNEGSPDTTGGGEVGEPGDTVGAAGEEAFEHPHKTMRSAPAPSVVFIFAKPYFITKHSFSKRLPRLCR